MSRIAVGGFQHETNTFAPVKADLEAFELADAWPGLTRGPALFEVFSGVNIPLAGFLDVMSEHGHDLVPLCWASATPSAHVTEHAFESICGMLVDDLRRAGPVDAVYLDLHGAMVVEHFDDGEGEILRRIVETVGSIVPVIASLDLHANVTPSMVEHAWELIAYRTYPHVDMGATGARAAQRLEVMLATGDRPTASLQQIPFLIPLTSQCTLNEPTASLMAYMAELETNGVESISFSPGFAPADFADCGPTVVAYGPSADSVRAASQSLADAVEAREAEFIDSFLQPEEAIARATAVEHASTVLLADTQDNPGAGGNADTIGILDALLCHDLPRSAIGVMYDPEAANAAHRAGVGAEISVGIGAKSGFPGETPLAATFEVQALGDGSFTATGPFWGGCRMQLGPMACLRHSNVLVVIASRKEQAGDQAMFRHVGVEPADLKLLALKSSVHFRADFEPIASEVMIVVSPGPNVADPANLHYQKLRHGVSLGPLGRSHGR